MSKLQEITIQIILSGNEKSYTMYETFLTELSLARETEIVEMLTYCHNNYMLEMPFGLKLISFRILCLMSPNNGEYKEWAENSIGFVGGPPWDGKVIW